MDIETRRRIRAYKKALPELRERVIAVALLLAMSASMLTSASFAWITLSRAPEAAGMQTTVAANGNLEIALAQGPMSQTPVPPGESQVGDSSATEGQTIVGSNITWGNLVNVSDPVYGLNEIFLRPALLSDYNRTEYPLNGATYGGDGRVVTTNDRYEFASYSLVDGTDDRYYFAAGKDKANYGVRAIASVGYQNFSGDVRAENFLKDTTQFYMDAQNYYGKIVAEGTNEVNTLDAAGGVTCISALEGLVTVFAQDKINEMGYGHGKGNPTSCSPYIWYLYQMLLRLEHALELEGLALLEMANWQAYNAYEENPNEKTFATIQDVIDASNRNVTVGDKTMTELESKGVTITTLKSYKDSLSSINYCLYGKGTDADPGLAYMASKCQNPDAPEVDYYWDDISKYVVKLVDISTATLAGKKLSEINGISAALEIIGGGEVIIYGGELYDIEKRFVNNDNRVSADVEVTVYVGKVTVKGITLDMKYQTIPGTVYTAVNYDVDTNVTEKDPEYIADFSYSEGQTSSNKGEATAKDTYGMAFDLWVRTNYPNAVLTLEGSAKYEDRPVTITVEGTQYDLYTITISAEDIQMEEDVYQKDGKWYYADTMEEVQETDISPKQKFTQVIVGYEGENRVWEDWRQMLELGYIEQDATTQGSGSCFVFYASPTEQPKIMEMLEAFNVAFIDQDGNKLGTAKLNLNSAYANQGKVTVPLEVNSGVGYTDESGNEKTGITTLAQNTPTMITAIVYLNGSDLKNENVLANGELQGQLNIQFGTNSTLVAPDNEELQMQARSITAAVTVAGQTITDGTIGGTEGLEYKPEGYPATVTLTIEGDQPERISGFFVRVVNNTQGTRGEKVDFTPNSDGTWTGNFTLTNPGTYAFNTLIVDGVQYTLHDGTQQSGLNEYYPSNRPYVYIQGLKLTSVSVDVLPGEHMTAATSMEFPVTVKLDAAVEPKQVNAYFTSEKDAQGNVKQYTAILSYDSINKEWTGSANISSSGTYTLQYVTVDGIPVEAPATGTYTLYLGLTASIGTTLNQADWQFNYTGPSQITMTARIYDDGYNPITNLSGVELTYRNIESPATLTWNGQYYEGVFDIIQPGELTFQSLNLGGYGTIYSVPNSPKFVAISLEKPEYRSAYNGGAQQIVIKNSLDATMRASLENAETASIYAQVKYTDVHNTDTTYYIPATGSGNERTFILPKLDGVWTMEALLLQQVYDPDYDNGAGNEPGKWYAKPASTETPVATTTIPEGEHMIIPTNQVSTEVIATYSIAVSYGGTTKNAAFTENYGNTTDAAFMTAYNSEVLQVKVSDYRGRAIDGVASVKWDITHDANTMKEYGGYTGNGKGTNTVTLTLKDGSTTEYVAPSQEFRVAGKYTSAITVDMGTNGTVSVSAVPTFTVKSKHPKLSIESYSPNGQHDSVAADGDRKVKTVKATSGRVGNTLTLYMNATGSNHWLWGPSISLKGEAQATLKFTGLGNANNATLTFTKDGGGTVHMYAGTASRGGTRTEQYLWDSTTGESVTRIFGYVDSGDCSSTTFAGKLISANEVILTYTAGSGTETYKVPIEVITVINNQAT